MCSVETWNLFCNWVIALARFSLHHYCISIGQKLQSKYILLERVMIEIMIIYIILYISIEGYLWQDFRCIITAFPLAKNCSQSMYYWKQQWSKLWSMIIDHWSYISFYIFQLSYCSGKIFPASIPHFYWPRTAVKVYIGKSNDQSCD